MSNERNINKKLYIIFYFVRVTNIFKEIRYDRWCDDFRKPATGNDFGNSLLRLCVYNRYEKTVFEWAPDSLFVDDGISRVPLPPFSLNRLSLPRNDFVPWNDIRNILGRPLRGGSTLRLLTIPLMFPEHMRVSAGSANKRKLSERGGERTSGHDSPVPCSLSLFLDIRNASLRDFRFHRSRFPRLSPLLQTGALYARQLSRIGWYSCIMRAQLDVHSVHVVSVTSRMNERAEYISIRGNTVSESNVLKIE